MAVIISRRSLYCPNFATALRNMGWTITEEQEQDIYYLWKVVGRMVGIAEDLMEGNDDIASSERTMDAIHSVDGEPDQASQDLVDALMTGFVVNVNALTEVPEESLADWTAAYTRIIHGDEVADNYGVAKSIMLPIIQMETEARAERYNLLRANPEALQAEIEKNEQMLIALLDDEPAYLEQDNGIVTKASA